MKRSLIVTIAVLSLSGAAMAQVDNYALSLSAESTVTCSPMTELNGLKSYSLQFFICPDTWTQGAVVLKRGDGMKVALGADGTLDFTVGGTTVSASGLSTGAWQQVTMVVDEGSARILIDGTETAAGTLESIPESDEQLVFGGGYSGRIDEVRIYKAALSSDFNYFINNTLNKFAPQWSDLVAYYKMDQNLCENVVDYCTIDADPGHHGTMNGGASRTLVTDNTKLPYLTNAAYTYNNRFFDRSVSIDQYLLSNEIIILGANSSNDGHLTLMTPNTHGTLSGGASYLAEYNGRSGVLSLDGTGSMTTTTGCLVPVVNSSGVTSQGYTFETWLYIDEWVEGAYLFRKESSDGTQGFSVRLGTEEGKQLIARCNGNDYYSVNTLKVGEWTHIGITTTTATTVANTYNFYFNGGALRKNGTSTTLSSSTIDYTPTGMDDIAAVIGENFKGKLDETTVWNKQFEGSVIKQHYTDGEPMPGFDTSLDAQTMLKAAACYLYDDPDEPGFSTYSQDGWLKIMKTAYDGYRGAKFYLSVNKHDNWTSTIANESKRNIFADDLAELSEPYDGVELDLEWIYNDATQFANYGKLAKAIKEALPDGKKFRISLHAVSYTFPKDMMQYVDGFTFQQYGPQSTYHNWSGFKSSAETFKNYGFADDKTLLSWSTTTSSGSAGAAVIGIKDLDSLQIDLSDGEMQSQVSNGNTFYFEGPRQVYRRAAYAVEQGVAGIFYWDMGNDYPTTSDYNCAKWASYGINSNVDRLVTEVNAYTPTGIKDISSTSVSTESAGAPTYNLAGQRVGESYKGIVVRNGKKMIKRQ